MMVRSVNPTTGQVIQEFSASTPAEISNAVEGARRAFNGVWSISTSEQRIELFNNLAQVLNKETDSLLDLILLEMGKPRSLGAFEIEDIVAGIAYYSSELRKISPLKFPIDDGAYPETNVDLPLVPHGVVGVISPWNFPFWTPMTNIVPAIMAGNTVVFKPDEHTTLMGLRIKELFDQAGFPQNVINVVIGAEEVGRALVTSDIDKIVLTGSTAAGADALQHVGIKPALMEL